MEANYPIRKNPRANFHDYSGGDYFVTICIKNRRCLFGKIENERMIYSPLGEACNKSIENIERLFKYVQIPLYVVMPNHIHMIVSINGEKFGNHKRSALSMVIGTYKRDVTLFARHNGILFKWQSRYHDHIIRGINDGNKISEYIQTNVQRWHYDCFYPGKLIVYK